MAVYFKQRSQLNRGILNLRVNWWLIINLDCPFDCIDPKRICNKPKRWMVSCCRPRQQRFDYSENRLNNWSTHLHKSACEGWAPSLRDFWIWFWIIIVSVVIINILYIIFIQKNIKSLSKYNFCEKNIKKYGLN